MLLYLLVILFCTHSESTISIKRFIKHKVFSNFEVSSTHGISKVECCLRCTNILDCFGVSYEDKECKILSNVSAVVGYETTKDTSEVLVDQDLLDNYNSYSKILKCYLHVIIAYQYNA